jgi:hypothetical protein
MPPTAPSSPGHRYAVTFRFECCSISSASCEYPQTMSSNMHTDTDIISLFQAAAQGLYKLLVAFETSVEVIMSRFGSRDKGACSASRSAISP